MNFALRIILTQEEGLASVQSIGTSYNYIDKDRNPTEFNKTHEIYFKSTQPDTTYGFLIYDHGKAIRPLFRKQEAYIMTDEGKTFENLTHLDDKVRG